jgi:gliding motility-associated lipoprotein GldD
MLRNISILLFFLFIASCRPDVFPPKPQGYFRLDTPEAHQYQVFDRPGFPYTFEYPVYSHIADDTSFQNEKQKNPYWINIEIPSMNGILNITYKQITKDQPLTKLNNDSWEYTFVHHVKAEGIEPNEFRNQFGVSGILYVVGGNTASRYQFTATDSVKHFLRGALYFDVTPNADSLKPVNDFLERDIEHLLKTLQWK